MSEVLVVGNGISRLLHEDLLEKWVGEWWGANYIYREFGHKLTRLTGHSDVLEQAMCYRDQHHLTFQLMGRVSDRPSTEVQLKVPREFRKDSGTVLIAQALEEGFNQVHVCGFDLGGPDVLSPGLQTQHKGVWIKRWIALLARYGKERIRFIGHDHMPFLLSGRHPSEYERRYLAGKPHIPDRQYIALFRLIYGPGSDWRKDRVVKVRFLKGAKPGYETFYRESIAQAMADKGKVEILEVVSEEPAPNGEIEDEINAETEVTTRMKVETLRKIADLRGLEDTEDLTKDELLELLRD